MPKISQRLEQKQKLNPRQILESSIMQLSTHVLEKRILEEIENNPTIEVDFEDSSNDDNSDSEDAEFNWEDLISNPEDYNLPKLHDSNIIENNSRKLSLIEDFTMQLNDLNLSKTESLIAELILGNLDEAGYLTIDPILISDKLQVEEKKVLNMIEEIKKLNPAGIGSRNLQECLLSQLMTNYPKELLAINVIKNFFDNFKKHNYSKIIEKVGCTSNDFNQILKLISILDPMPGIVFSDYNAEHINPDIIVEKNKGEWDIITNNSFLPKIMINNEYKKMAIDKDASNDVKKFLKQKIDSANWFIDAISNRYNTIEKIMISIIKHQSSYFDSDQRELSPLVMKTIAKDINMDISTISRAVNDKYVQLPWGCFELRSFFSEGIHKQDGSIISNTVIKKIIKEIINKEDKKSPYTDLDIANLLISKGYNISRRTVAKYRESLKISTSRLRKNDI